MAKVMTTRPKVVKLPPIAEKGRLNLIGKFVFQKCVYLLVECSLKSKVHKGHGLSRISGISFNCIRICHRRGWDKNRCIKDLTLKILYLNIVIFKF